MEEREGEGWGDGWEGVGSPEYVLPARTSSITKERGVVGGVWLGGKKVEFRPQTFTMGFRQQTKILAIEKTRF